MAIKKAVLGYFLSSIDIIPIVGQLNVLIILGILKYVARDFLPDSLHREYGANRPEE